MAGATSAGMGQNIQIREEDGIITVIKNGVEYKFNTPTDMPPDIRQAYERSKSMIRAIPILNTPNMQIQIINDGKKEEYVVNGIKYGRIEDIQDPIARKFIIDFKNKAMAMMQFPGVGQPIQTPVQEQNVIGPPIPPIGQQINISYYCTKCMENVDVKKALFGGLKCAKCGSKKIIK